MTRRPRLTDAELREQADYREVLGSEAGVRIFGRIIFEAGAALDSGRQDERAAARAAFAREILATIRVYAPRAALRLYAEYGGVDTSGPVDVETDAPRQAPRDPL